MPGKERYMTHKCVMIMSSLTKWGSQDRFSVFLPLLHAHFRASIGQSKTSVWCGQAMVPSPFQSVFVNGHSHFCLVARRPKGTSFAGKTCGEGVSHLLTSSFWCEPYLTDKDSCRAAAFVLFLLPFWAAATQRPTLSPLNPGWTWCELKRIGQWLLGAKKIFFATKHKFVLPLNFVFGPLPFFAYPRWIWNACSRKKSSERWSLRIEIGAHSTIRDRTVPSDFRKHLLLGKRRVLAGWTVFTFTAIP